MPPRRLLLRTFAGPRWRVRRATYTSTALAALFFLFASVYLDSGIWPVSDQGRLRTFLYGIVVMFEGVGALNIRAGVMYGAAYRIEKALGTTLFMGLFISAGTGLAGSTFTSAIWFTGILITKVAIFEWIVSRNAILDKGGLHTAFGKIPPPSSRDEVVAVLSTGASYIRHGYATDDDIAEMELAIDAPNISDWAKERVEILSARRQRAAELQEAGIEIEARDLDPDDPTRWPQVR